jgi:phage protein D
MTSRLRTKARLKVSLPAFRPGFSPGRRTRILAEITTADIEDFVAHLKEPTKVARHQKTARVRKPATIVRQELEDNRRHRRISKQDALLAAANRLETGSVFKFLQDRQVRPPSRPPLKTLRPPLSR